VPEVLDERGAGLLRQGQHPLPAALAGLQAELPRTPIQVIELKGSDLARAQAEARQQQDRPVAVLGWAGCGWPPEEHHGIMPGPRRAKSTRSLGVSLPSSGPLGIIQEAA
jgi:hypothetical protein